MRPRWSRYRYTAWTAETWSGLSVSEWDHADLAAHEVVPVAEVAERAEPVEDMAERGAAVGHSAGEDAVSAVGRPRRHGVLDGVPVGPDHFGADGHLDRRVAELEGPHLHRRGAGVRSFPGPEGQDQPSLSHLALPCVE